MTDELKKLNDLFFKLFSELHEHKKFVGSEENYLFIDQRIFEQYQIEYGLLRLRCEIETEKELFTLREERAEYIPERWRKFSWRKLRRRTFENEAARLIAEQIQTEADKYFDALEKKLQALQSGQEVEEETAVQEKQEAQGLSEEPKKDDAELSDEEREFVKPKKRKGKTKV